MIVNLKFDNELRGLIKLEIDVWISDYLLIVYEHHEIHLLIEKILIAGINLSVGSIADVDGNDVIALI